MTRPIGVDLFAGAGGLSLGFEQAGFDVVAAVEIDPVHSAVHAFNFPECAVLPRPIAEVTGESIRAAAGIRRKRVDVVFGGPPCQGFSLIGQRALEDPRNGLVREFVRIVQELEPRYFLFENVKGLTIGKHRKFLEELIGEFQGAGYSLTLPWRVLNAADYGVPQDRQRLFLLGARAGEMAPEYPAATHARRGSGRLALAATPTCSEAIGDLPEPGDFRVLLRSDEAEVAQWPEASGYARTLRCCDAADWGFGHRREWNPRLLTSSMRTIHSPISMRRFEETTPGEVEPISRFFRLPPQGQANTLRAGTDAARGAFTSPRPIHFGKARCVTVREMARLHGYPDWFRFHMTKWHGARQVGNSVPPPLARALAGQIVAAMNEQATRPNRIMPLGDPRLLRMDMSEAAAYWGVEAPIARRDRKSGARKRRQAQIELSLQEKYASDVRVRIGEVQELPKRNSMHRLDQVARAIIPLELLGSRPRKQRPQISALSIRRILPRYAAIARWQPGRSSSIGSSESGSKNSM